jgi:nucleotide-binding universal stress UspA family protein
MSLKDILVYLDKTSRSDVRLETAINLAAAHGAHLTGLHVITYPRIPGYIKSQIDPVVMEEAADNARAAAATAESSFNEQVARAGISAEWRSTEGEDVVEQVRLHARYCDVAVVGQHDPESGDLGSAGDMPDRLILSAGRPMLLVPYVGSYPAVGDRIMVAWDSSRLATRAVNDALPFLRAAKHVDVIAINPHGGPEGHGDIPSADICLHLSRHGVTAQAQHLTAGDIEAGDMLLSRAADLGSDMIVMGAYGHARWRELVLGGVTQHMLNHMTVPVFMSH